MSGPDDDAKRFFELTYKSIASVNLALSTLIIGLNILVIAYYWRNRTKLTSLLFVIIATSDMLAALGNFSFALGTVLWIKDPEKYDRMMWWCYIFYRIVALSSYCSSIFFNALLAVLRTIVIYNPFHRPKVLIMKIVSVTYILLILALTGYDTYFFATLTTDTVPKPHVFSDILIFWYFLAGLASVISFPGQTITWELWVQDGFEQTRSGVVEFTMLAIQFLIPVVSVFVSMVVQIVTSRRRANSEDDPTTGTAIDWRHVNTTVFLIAALFFLCNAALTADFIGVEVYSSHLDDDPADWVYKLFGTAQTLLPLINSLLSPIILVMRNARMKQDIKTLMRRFFQQTETEDMN